MTTASELGEPILATRNLTKAYGGLRAVDGVSLALHAGRPHAVIGPNGAGKSSLINLISGQVAPTSGEIRLKGRDIAGLTPNRIARLGLGRSFQKTNIYPSLTCYENCWLAGQTRLAHSMQFLRPASQHRAIAEKVEEALEAADLIHRSGTVAAMMSYGEQRQLEIAMVLATGPALLALDEPMAGMGREESEKVIDLLLDLRKTYPLLLVEHDMDAVFSIAHTLTVMVNGRVIASGTVAEVRNSKLVQEAYLGDGEEKY
ncbi:ABC transporter ATP-binding protein [Azospirillum sp.]|uniref:ABC transporter ATP-binding protein n=1 Tax=Azospirillum sp. TaxID=34012 RepID=UPI00262E64D1|nr:ABC transporter ATP-binding protein [Azospirillum sp.]